MGANLAPSWLYFPSPGASWGHLGGVLGRLGGVLGRLGGLLGRLGTVLGVSWAVLERRKAENRRKRKTSKKQKLRSGIENVQLELHQKPKLLDTVRRKFPNLVMVGFKVEVEENQKMDEIFYKKKMIKSILLNKFCSFNNGFCFFIIQ